MKAFANCTNLLVAQNTEVLQVKEYKLNNGLTIWLNEDHSQPKIVGAVVVNAGAKDCPDTGIAHYFEHIMFKGTDKIGTLNYEAEKIILDAISDKYDELAATDNVAARIRLQQEINQLSIRSSEYIIPNEFNRLISKYGGSELNAATSYDSTIYFNTFSSQYLAQWAEINSERLLNPVFRLFQNELETVYEEKNMYGDILGGQAMEKLLFRYFTPHPYAYPIVGSTLNLRNPRLTEMRTFFEHYYVASNMALILSGDFDAEIAMPILERSFSRIRAGEAPKKEVAAPLPFQGKEKMKIKLPIPFVKMMGLGFRGVPANHEDKIALNIAVNILNNANGTGYLDKLTVNHKVIATMALNESMNDAGILAVAVVPKLLRSYASAEKLVWNEINRVKSGDFSDQLFDSLKLEQKRQYVSNLENIDSRVTVMMNLFSQRKNWASYLDEVSKIDAMTREDVVRAAQKYMGDDYLYITKSTGNYPKDDLSKPDFAPVIPTHTEASSAYAMQLEQMPIQEIKPRFIHFKEDVETVKLTPLVTLYTKTNPLNDIFTLDLFYGVGLLERPALQQLASYLQFIGTDSQSFEKFRTNLQTLGSTISFDTNDTDFIIKITGFDNYLNETLALAGDFIRHAKADDKKMHQVVEEAKITKKAFFKSSDNIASALLEKVKYGDQSRYLTKLSLSQIKKLKAKDMIDLFTKVCQTECSLHYCGTLSTKEVAVQVRLHIPLDGITVSSKSPIFRDTIEYSSPLVCFIHIPDVSQSIIYSYVKGDIVDDKTSRHASRLFSVYFGGDMSSLMFQEIREFRSLAYRTSGRYGLPFRIHKGKTGSFVTMLSTQADKTLDALCVLDSLIREMPLKPERIGAVKQAVVSQVNNDYPSFRNMSEKIAKFLRDGFIHDPNEDLLNGIAGMDIDDISHFYQANISGRPIVYVIAGDKKHIDMSKLASFGTITRVIKKDIYK